MSSTPRSQASQHASQQSVAISKRQTEKPLAKLAIGGVVSVIFEAFALGHYMEFLKIAKQCAPPTATYTSITREMIGQKGLSGVLDGFLPWGAIMSILKGASFSYGQALAKNFIPQTMDERHRTILSGGFGGLAQGICMNPALLLKTRVMTDARFRATPVVVTGHGGGVPALSGMRAVAYTASQSTRLGMELISNEGISALFKGVTVFSFKRFCDWTTRYAFVDGLERGLIRAQGRDPDQKLPMQLRMVCALGGGILSASATLPIDVTVARIQDAKKAGKPVAVSEICKEIGGNWRLATRGFVPRAAHVALSTLLMKNVTSALYDKLYR